MKLNMQPRSTQATDTYSQTIAKQLTLQSCSKKLKQMTIAIGILNAFLILAICLSVDPLFYSLFIVGEFVAVGGIALYTIHCGKPSQKVCQLQKYVVLGCTVVEAGGVLALAAFGFVTTTNSGTILGYVFELMVPGLIVVGLKLYLVIVRKIAQGTPMEQQMRTENIENFYAYKEIDETTKGNN